MLTPADAELVRRDPALPGLATVLDPAAVVDRLAAAGDGPPVVAATATYVRYKPGTSCLVGYELFTEAASILGYAKAFRPAEPGKLEKARENEVPDRSVGWGVTAIGAESVTVAAASSDRDLPAMAALSDPPQRTELLGRLLPDRPDLWGAEPVALRHKPERRWVGAIEHEGKRVALVKAYRRADVRRARIAQKALAASGVKPLGWWERRAILASAWVPGRTVAEALAVGADIDVGALAASLARLHARRARSLPVSTTADVIAAVDATACAVAALSPELGRRARGVARLVAGELAGGQVVTTVVHGDFSPDQVVLASGAPVFIDFDEAAIGDPALDLGTFAATLERQELEGRLAPGWAAELTAELVASYRAAGGPPVEGRLAVHRSAALLRLAVAPFRERRADWPSATEAIVARAETSARVLA